MSSSATQPIMTSVSADKVYLPSGLGNTSYFVQWVEWLNRGAGDNTEFKRVYLSRYIPSWGTALSP